MDTILRTLAHNRRREIVAMVASSESSTAAVPLEDTVPEEEPPEEVLIRLVHHHIPKLDKADIINWDREADVVTRGPLFADAQTLVKTVRELETDNNKMIET